MTDRVAGDAQVGIGGEFELRSQAKRLPAAAARKVLNTVGRFAKEDWHDIVLAWELATIEAGACACPRRDTRRGSLPLDVSAHARSLTRGTLERSGASATAE
jgi:hypothetical protein